ncbi:MAG: hypothetical protein F6K41_23140 [Symploca sp. SIO3E6]|nr:hypothetical protein [Caldora sp. SIO3E6]
MKWRELQQQALQLVISDRWLLVNSLLTSIQQETQSSVSASSTTECLSNLAPWTQSLIGVIEPEAENMTLSYVDYLEEKYL